MGESVVVIVHLWLMWKKWARLETGANVYLLKACLAHMFHSSLPATEQNSKTIPQETSVFTFCTWPWEFSHYILYLATKGMQPFNNTKWIQLKFKKPNSFKSSSPIQKPRTFLWNSGECIISVFLWDQRLHTFKMWWHRLNIPSTKKKDWRTANIVLSLHNI